MLTRDDIDLLRGLTKARDVRFRWGKDAQGFFAFVGRDEPQRRSFCRTMGEAMSVLALDAAKVGSGQECSGNLALSVK